MYRFLVLLRSTLTVMVSTIVFTGTLSNAGRAEIRGIELEASARVTDAFSLNAMFGFIDAGYTKYIGAGNLDVTNSRSFQNTPGKSASLRGTYDWPMAMMGMNGKLSLIGSVAYRSDTQQFETATPLLDQAAYSLWDASLVWSSTDNRIRREVVGQMLDYAANAVLYWPVETIRQRFEETCRERDSEPDMVVAEFIGLSGDIDSDRALTRFWESVETNLRAGKIRLIFAADVIPPELKRIIEFLNEQMNPAEILGIEIRVRRDRS